ncbi:hypothetical protein ACHAW5_001826 [Stephanodiscus triporus]|uniref:Uncharacterized protein n=1 Tax=Stephanodiscus triporus TaxID=2934178 RepID=A0ABD3MP28_9STRA
MLTRFYLCAFLVATIVASNSALETKDYVAPLEDSPNIDKAKLHGKRALMADWWDDDWWEAYQLATKRQTRRQTGKPTRKPMWKPWNAWQPTTIRPAKVFTFFTPNAPDDPGDNKTNMPPVRHPSFLRGPSRRRTPSSSGSTARGTTPPQRTVGTRSPGSSWLRVPTPSFVGAGRTGDGTSAKDPDDFEELYAKIQERMNVDDRKSKLSH